MTKCKYIDDYISNIQKGTIPASKKLIKATHYIQKKLDDENVFIDLSKIEKAKELIERYFEITLLNWQLFILALIHCYYIDGDTVVFDEFLIVMGRGNGKNGFISPISWYLTTHYHGVQGYNVDIVANSEDQAKTSFEDVLEVLEHFANVLKKFFYWTKSIIVNLRTKSYIRYNTSNARTKDGKRSACLVFDELHEYENSKIISVFTSGFGKKKHSRIFKLTTNGDVREGVLDDDLAIADDVLDGIITDLGLCPLIYMADNEADVQNPKMWVKANPSLPYFPELRKQMDKEFIKMKYDSSLEQVFYTKRMNLPKNMQDTAVVSYEIIKKTHILDGKERLIPNLEGQACVVGIDYASVGDMVSVNLRFKQADIKYDINQSWLCLNSKDLKRIKAPWQKWADSGLLYLVDDVEIHPDLITQWIEEQAKKYVIKKIALDNYRYALMKNALEAIGFDPLIRKNLKLVKKGDIMSVVPLIESDFNNGRFVWGDNPVLRWATNNSKRVRSSKNIGSDTGNFYYAKIEGRSRKTDPFMAVVACATIDDELNTGATALDMPTMVF